VSQFFGQWSLFIITIGVLAALGWKKSFLLIPLLASVYALDISRTWYPSFIEIDANLGIIDLTRMVSISIILCACMQAWLNREKRQELKAIFSNYLTWALVIYMAVGMISVTYSVDQYKTVIEVIRLLFLFALFLGICLLSESKQVFLPLHAVHAMGVALTPLAIYEAVTRNFIWQEKFAEGIIARPPATFVDANIFARYLILAIVANLVLLYFTKTRQSLAIYYVTLAAIVGALLVTFSRSGYLTLAIILLVMIGLIPRKKMFLVVGLLGGGGIVILAFLPAIRQRMLTIGKGIGALDAQRLYLMKAAWAMFQSHPFIGVGLGGFQKMFLSKYFFLKTVADGATLSHTTLLTIAAELGLLGLVSLTWVWVALIRVMRKLNKLSQEEYVIGAAYFLWILTIFISSQSEARFFEDPLIWLSMGMMLRLSGDFKRWTKKTCVKNEGE